MGPTLVKLAEGRRLRPRGAFTSNWWMHTPIKGILFDIGGVLATLDGVPFLAAFLDTESDEAIYARWSASASVVAHETGRMSVEEFAAAVVGDLNLPVTAESFLQEFCCWPRSVKPGAIELLDDIPGRYCVAALSNTSAVHWDRVRALGLAGRFTRAYLSHELQCMKPAEQAYRFALSDMALRPSEVVFLDDAARNVEAARALGIHAHVVRDPQEARRVLEEYGVVAARA